MTSYPQTLAVKKLTKMGFFYKDIYYISSSDDADITHNKNRICGLLHFNIIHYYILTIFVQADLERQWTDIKEKVMEEIFRLCRSLLLSKNFDSTKYVLDQWFSFCEGDVTKGLRKFYGY